MRRRLLLLCLAVDDGGLLGGQVRVPRGRGFQPGEGQVAGHVAHLPEQQHQVGGDQRDAEGHELDPGGIAHQHHRGEDQAETQQEPEQGRPGHQRGVDASGDGEQIGGEQEVHHHDREAVDRREHAVDAPEQR